jgi:hypothetical protein
MSISVLLADDQPLLRRGLRMIIEAEDDLTVTGEAADGGQAVAGLVAVLTYCTAPRPGTGHQAGASRRPEMPLWGGAC